MKKLIQKPIISEKHFKSAAVRGWPDSVCPLSFSPVEWEIYRCSIEWEKTLGSYFFEWKLLISWNQSHKLWERDFRIWLDDLFLAHHCPLMRSSRPILRLTAVSARPPQSSIIEAALLNAIESEKWAINRSYWKLIKHFFVITGANKESTRS